MSHRNIPTKGKRGPRQAHLNKAKFDPSRYRDRDQMPDASFLAVMHSLCCRRCCEKLQWKIDFAKYQPLEVPRRCNGCGEKAVAIAYHHMCQECAKAKAVCAKCCRPPLKELLLRDAGAGAEGGARAGGDSSGSDSDRGGAEGEKDSGEVDAEGRASMVAGQMTRGKSAAAAARFAHIDDPCSDEEFAALRGLDISRLRAHKRRLMALDAAAAKAQLRERERRAAVRKEEKEKAAAGGRGGDVMDFEDSDEEL